MRSWCAHFSAPSRAIRRTGAAQTWHHERESRRDFAAEQVRQLLTQFASAEEMERKIFFTKDPYQASQQSDSATRAKYAGCAYCHEVKQTARRVLSDGRDRPAGHDRSLDAARAFQSCETANGQLPRLPRRRAVSQSHVGRADADEGKLRELPRPKGVAMKASECMTCHTYHAPEPRPPAAARPRRLRSSRCCLAHGRESVVCGARSFRLAGLALPRRARLSPCYRCSKVHN